MAGPRISGPGSGSKKKKFRSDGTPLWGRPNIDGPGVWVSCIKGKERATVGELTDLFESLAANLWPIEDQVRGTDEHNDSDDDLSIEEQIARQVSAIKRPRREKRFVNCNTDTTCVVFISCRPPVDPVKLVETHIQNVKSSGVTRTRYALRFVPVSGSCYASLPDIKTLCRSTVEAFFTESERVGKAYTYKIELRIRNHTTLTRPNIVQALAECVPPEHKVELTSPQVFILVEVFKSVCGISVTENYYDLLKFNVMGIATSSSSDRNDTPRIDSRPQ